MDIVYSVSVMIIFVYASIAVCTGNAIKVSASVWVKRPIKAKMRESAE